MPRGRLRSLLEGRTGTLVFVLALVLRLAAVFLFADHHHPDDLEYGAIARNLLAGEGYSFSYPVHYLGERTGTESTADEAQPTAFMAPLYTWLLTGLLAVFGPEAYLVLYLLQALAGALAALLLYRTAVVIFDDRSAKDRTALIAGLLAAVFPTFVGSAALVLPTTLEQLVGCALLYTTAGIARNPEQLRFWLFAGLLLGVGGLLREVVLAYGPLIVLVGLLAGKQRRERLGGRVLLRGGTAALIALAVLAPWMVRNAAVFDRFIPVTNRLGYNLYRGFNERADGFDTSVTPAVVENGLDDVWRTEGEAAFDEALGAAALDYIADNPGRAALLVLKRLGFGLVGELDADAAGIGRLGTLRYLVYAAQLGLFVAALFGCWLMRKLPAATRALIYGFFTVYLLAILLTFVCTRFRVPLETVYCLPAALALNRLMRRFTNRSGAEKVAA
jgi:hypothetical protein